MDFVFKLEASGNSASLNAQGVEAVHVSKLIDGMFGAFGIPVEILAPIELPKEKIGPVIQPLKVEKPQKEILAKEEHKTEIKPEEPTINLAKKHESIEMVAKSEVKTEIQQRPRQLPVINGERALHTSIAELIPNHHKTGFKVREDGTKLLKTRITCPECGNKRNRYLPINEKEVICFECQTVLRVEPATENGFGETNEHQDGWGNFMIANKISEPSESYTP